jgi:uncharacterized protein (DUF3084 family)
MAVQLEQHAQRYRGLSTDEKPGRNREEVGGEFQKVPVGSVFTEIDTGRRYVWTGAWPWVRQEQTIEELLERLIDVNARILEVVAATQRGHEEYLWENEAPSE